jgi:hypothetical protein
MANGSRPGVSMILNDIQPYLDLLNELCSMGTPVRKILVDYMINEHFYKQKIQSESSRNLKINFQIDEEDTEAKKPIDSENYSHNVYLNALNSQQKIKVPQKFSNKTKEICDSISGYMIDEFLFWCIRFEFPENLVKFLLSLLPDLRYKQIFIKSFVSQYSFISVLLLNSKSEHLSSRVVHISVQLFSNEAIAMKAVEESNLLPIILSTLYNMIVTPYHNEKQNSIENEFAGLLIKYNSENRKFFIFLI